MSETLTPAQQRTLPARQAMATKFATPEEKSAHFRAIGERGNAGRIVLSGDEAKALADHTEALGQAYQLLASIAERARLKLGTPTREIT